MNIAQRLSDSAKTIPDQKAVVVTTGYDDAGKARYAHLTFRELDRESDRLARGLVEMGVTPGTRLVLMVRPSLEYVALTFALFKAGAVTILIDPGMGRDNIFRCLEEVEPEGFVAIPVVQAIRKLKGRMFPKAGFNVTVGRRWFWGGPKYQHLLGREWTPFNIPETRPTDPAAIIFTSGSTGPPKGVLYEHGMFNAQVELLRDFYNIQPGEVDISAFPLFALFNSGMGVTTVIPDMNPTKPAQVNPKHIIGPIHDLQATQAFGSPALWNNVGRYCEEHNVKFPTLKRALSAGAPVPTHVLARMRKTFPNAETDIHTPYGATESLPVCSISGKEVLEKTAAKTRIGAGTCVGHRFPHIELKIIEITDGPIRSLDDVKELPQGEIGEIIVRGPSTTREYFKRPEATANAKIPDDNSFWHRMGDTGYLDEENLLWFCGRKAHMLETEQGGMFTIRCEAIINEHPCVYRSALVGIGPKPHQKPAIFVEPEADQFPQGRGDEEQFLQELKNIASANPLTKSIETFFFLNALPVDIRHNVKINREQLALQAAELVRSEG